MENRRKSNKSFKIYIKKKKKKKKIENMVKMEKKKYY